MRVQRSRLRRLGTAAPFFSLLALSQAALAHEEDAPPEPKRKRAPTVDPSEYRTEQYAAFEFRLGPYRPNVDSEFNGTTPFTDIFGTGQSIFLGLEADWQALRIPYLGTLGPGLGWGIVRYGADAPLVSNPNKRSKQPTSFWIMPISGLAVLRIDVLAREFDIPLVPYGKFGLTYALWEAGDAGRTSVDAQGVAGQGSEFGLEYHLGGMLHLNFFAPQASLDMDNTTGVNHAYLFFEWQNSQVNSFGKGMEVGTSTFMTGLVVEY